MREELAKKKKGESGRTTKMLDNPLSDLRQCRRNHHQGTWPKYPPTKGKDPRKEKTPPLQKTCAVICKGNRGVGKKDTVARDSDVQETVTKKGKKKTQKLDARKTDRKGMPGRSET